MDDVLKDSWLVSVPVCEEGDRTTIPIRRVRGAPPRGDEREGHAGSGGSRRVQFHDFHGIHLRLAVRGPLMVFMCGQRRVCVGWSGAASSESGCLCKAWIEIAFRKVGCV